MCDGIAAIRWCQEFDGETVLALAADAEGNTYMATSVANDGSRITKLGPDHLVHYRTRLPYSRSAALAAGPDGRVWANCGGLFQIDSQGNSSSIAFSGNLEFPLMTSDAAGNLYILGSQSLPGYFVAKLSPDGTQAGTFSLQPYGTPAAIAVDLAGAVYVTGLAADGFTPTPGAAFSTGLGFVLKIAPGFDRAVWATRCMGVYTGYGSTPSPSAIGVDSLGSVYVGGFWGDGTPPPVPIRQISPAPVAQNSVSLFLFKLNPDGSALVWCDGFKGLRLVGVSVLPDGRVRATVNVDLELALFTIRAAGDRLESANYLRGTTHAGAVAAVPAGVSAPPRVAVVLASAQIPVVFDDHRTNSVVVDFLDPPPQADLSVSARQTRSQNLSVTVRNNGPDDADGVFVTGFQAQCEAGEAAICYVGNGTLIPKLAAGQSMDFHSTTVPQCGSPGGCSWAFPARALALTSDPDISNNAETVQWAFVNGSEIPQTCLMDFFYFKSGDPYFVGRCADIVMGDPEITLWAPVQNAAGNIWYFDEWADGSRQNPRTFDASNGAPPGLASMRFRKLHPIGLDPGSMDFVTLSGSSPQPRTIKLIANDPSGYRPGTWIVATPRTSWLKLTGPDSGGRLIGTADSSGLAPGYYSTSLSAIYRSAGVPDDSMEIPVSLRILASPPTINRIVNAASLQAGPVRNLDMLMITGTGLGPPLPEVAFVPQAGQLPLELGGTSVRCGDQSAELLYVQDRAIILVFPNNSNNACITQATFGGSVMVSAHPEWKYQAGTPALFTLNGSGTENLAALNSDGSVNGPGYPAHRGSVITLYGTGFWWETIPSSNLSFRAGNHFGTPSPQPTRPVEAFVGSKQAYILYSGTAPGMHFGVQQFRILLPDDSDTGSAVPVRLGIPFPNSIDSYPTTWYSTQPGTTLAIE